MTIHNFGQLDEFVKGRTTFGFEFLDGTGKSHQVKVLKTAKREYIVSIDMGDIEGNLVLGTTNCGKTKEETMSRIKQGMRERGFSESSRIGSVTSDVGLFTTSEQDEFDSISTRGELLSNKWMIKLTTFAKANDQDLLDTLSLFEEFKKSDYCEMSVWGVKTLLVSIFKLQHPREIKIHHMNDQDISKRVLLLVGADLNLETFEAQNSDSLDFQEYGNSQLSRAIDFLGDNFEV